MKAFVFPGQGSQTKGMGKGLFEEFSDLVKTADDILGYSIRDLCQNDPENLLNRTDHTQPALFTVCALSYLKRIKDGESKPDYVAGHSIGEYAALFAAGVIDFETGIKLVKKRGELMAKAAGGKMAAVIGIKEDKIAEVLKSNRFDGIDIANFNTPTQIVLSGPEKEILAAEKVFRNTEGCIMYKVLNVSGAFHSRYMRIAREDFTEYLNSFEFNKLDIPVIANTTARPYKTNEIVETLSKQLVSSVHWTDSVRYMMAKGVKEFVEIGPGHVVQGMIRKIQREAEPLDLRFETTSAASEEAVRANGERRKITADRLGNNGFMHDYNLKYAYLIGGMYKGISGEKLVTASAKAGLLAFFGTAGLSLARIEEAVENIQKVLQAQAPYGFDFMFDLSRPEREYEICGIYLKHGVHIIEASGFSTITKALVKYRLTGIETTAGGTVTVPNSIIAKLSRPEIARGFMSPPPQRIVDALLRDGEITDEEARLSQFIPMACDICVEADSAGHTDRSNLFSVFPAIKALRERMVEKYAYPKEIHVGAAGGIGTPAAAAAAFVMGADFIVTGSINQCTVEAAVSDAAKDMLNAVDVQDTGYIQDMGEIPSDSKIQVLKKGTLFMVRANKLRSLYLHHHSLDEIDEKTKKQIETRYFKKSFEEVFAEATRDNPNEAKRIAEAENEAKEKMRLVFNWYLTQAEKWAIDGDTDYQLDYKIMCGPALGAFNQLVKGGALESWKNRNVVGIAKFLMEATAGCLEEYIASFAG